MTVMRNLARLACLAAGLGALIAAGCRPAPSNNGAAAADPGRLAFPSQAESPEPAANSYEGEIRKFQRDREAVLKSDTGWLTIAGLFFLSQPQMTFGSDPVNDIVLPASAPARAGTFDLRNGKVSVKAAPGVSFQLGDKTITS